MSKDSIILPNSLLLGEVSALLAEGHPVVLMTKGNSMLPFIRGDKDSVRLVAAEEYKTGQAVLAQIGPGHYVLHRLVEIDGENVTLQGDGNLRGREHCRRSDICGVVTQVLRPGGKTAGPRDDCAAKWRRLPYIIRRVVLAIYRRIQ